MSPKGGFRPWKRGVDSRGVGHAHDHALRRTCDAHLQSKAGSDALEAYSKAADANITRFAVSDYTIDKLSAGALRVWLTGHDPVTGEERGTPRLSVYADLVLEATLNHPKSFSFAAPLNNGAHDAGCDARRGDGSMAGRAA